jgi:hypothetical protein
MKSDVGCSHPNIAAWVQPLVIIRQSESDAQGKTFGIP